MEKNYKIVPFDIEKAKAGAEVVTKKDKLKVEILKYDLKTNFQIVAVVNFSDSSQNVYFYYSNGNILENEEHDYDLIIKEEIKSRRMTNQEIAWWLRDCPEEYREWKYKCDGIVYQTYEYVENDANDERDDILIRSNGGEWREPLVEEEDVIKNID